MSVRILGLLLFLAVVGTPGAVLADEIAGADKILCSSVQATVCQFDGGCETGPPWSWNVPQFIEVDLVRNTLATTAASVERRETPFANHRRDAGVLFIQGIENGRAFSIVIDEASGQLSAAIARERVTVSVFGACTPRS